MSKAGKINVLKEQNALKYGHVALSPSSQLGFVTAKRKSTQWHNVRLQRPEETSALEQLEKHLFSQNSPN